MKKNKRAFNLIELAAVVALVGLFVVIISGSGKLIDIAKNTNMSSIQTTSIAPIPLQVSNLQNWYETSLGADNFGGSILSDGDKLDTLNVNWTDMSGNNRDAVPISQYGGPMLANRVHSTINGYDMIRFDGSHNGDSMEFNLTSIENDNTFMVFIVCIPQQMPSYSNLLEFVQGSGGVSPATFSVGASYGEGANNKPDRYRVRLGGVVIDTPFGTKAGYQPTIISAGSRGLGANDLFIRLNGNNEYTAQGGAPTRGGGSRSNDTTGAIGGLYARNDTHAAIAEILIYDSALSDADLSLIESYLSKKYDITLTE